MRTCCLTCIFIDILKLRLSLFRLLYYTLFYFELLSVTYFFRYNLFDDTARGIFWKFASEAKAPRTTSKKNIAILSRDCSGVLIPIFCERPCANELFFKPFVTNNHVSFAPPSSFIDIQSPLAFSIKVQIR